MSTTVVPSHQAGFTKDYQVGGVHPPPKSSAEILAESGYVARENYTVVCSNGENTEMMLPINAADERCPKCGNERGTRPGQCNGYIKKK